MLRKDVMRSDDPQLVLQKVWFGAFIRRVREDLWRKQEYKRWVRNLLKLSAEFREDCNSRVKTGHASVSVVIGAFARLFALSHHTYSQKHSQAHETPSSACAANDNPVSCADIVPGSA